MYRSEGNTLREESHINPAAWFEGTERAATDNLVLIPGAVSHIPTESALYADPENGCRVIARIIATRDPLNLSTADDFLLLDMRRSPRTSRGLRWLGGAQFDTNASFLLIGRDFDGYGRGHKGLSVLDPQVSIGRWATAGVRFNLQETTSREHFSLFLVSGHNPAITDNRSANGTTLQIPQVRPYDHQRRAYERFTGANPGGTQDAPRQPAAEPSEDVTQGLDSTMCRHLDEVREAFRSEYAGNQLSDVMVIGLLKRIQSLRAEGLSTDRIRRTMLTEVHPDKVHGQGAEYDIYTAMSKVVGHLLR